MAKAVYAYEEAGVYMEKKKHEIDVRDIYYQLEQLDTNAAKEAVDTLSRIQAEIGNTLKRYAYDFSYDYTALTLTFRNTEGRTMFKYDERTTKRFEVLDQLISFLESEYMLRIWEKGNK